MQHGGPTVNVEFSERLNRLWLGMNSPPELPLLVTQTPFNCIHQSLITSASQGVCQIVIPSLSLSSGPSSSTYDSKKRALQWSKRQGSIRATNYRMKDHIDLIEHPKAATIS